MKLNLKHAAVFLMLFGSATVAFAQQQMPPIPVDKQVRIGKLDNGLTYYIRKNNLPEKQADFYIAQKVGSILEEEHQRGLAHFLEHMCFNGTKNFPGKGIIHYLETIGVRFGENLNAYTSIDETVYNISNVPVVRDGVVDSCLLILHDWANDLSLEDKEIDSERGVIHEEWRTRLGAMSRMYEKILPTVYPNCVYGHRMPIGLMSIVDNFPYQALRDYYEKWYRPDQQGIIVVGDIDVDQVEKKIVKMFSPIEMPKNPAKREYVSVPDNKEPIVTIAKDKEQPNTLVYVWHKHDDIADADKVNMDYMVVDYMRTIISNMLNTRLNELTQTAEPPFIGASVTDGDFFLSKTKGAFMGGVACKEDGVNKALASLVREMERARQFGFTASEYARAKAEYLRMLESAYNERNKVKNDSYSQDYVRHFVDNEPIPGIENEYAIMNQIVPNIPVEAINQFMKTLIREDNLVVNAFFPDKEGIKYPTEQELLKVLNDVKVEKLTAYVDKVSDEPLLAKTPEAGKVVKEETGAFGSTVWILSNGVRVIMKSTDFKADQIRMRAFSPGGTSIFGVSEPLEIQTANQVIDLGGVGNFSVIELEKMLAGKKVGVAPYMHSLTEGFEGSCSPKDLETMMQLTYLYFTSPRMDANAFESFKKRTKAALANQEANPMVTYSDSIQSTIYGKHPLIQRLTSDRVDKIDYNRIMEMYKDRFKDASDFTFTFVGNINPQEVKPMIETYLGSLPSIHRTENFKDINLDIRKGNHKNVFTKALETPKASVMVMNSGKGEYNLRNKLTMSMLNQTLDMVYTETVREKEGGTYGVGVSGQISRYPAEDEWILQIFFDTDPAKREKMVEIIINELEKVAKQGPRPEHLKKVKEFMQKKYAELVKENGYWMQMLNEYYFFKADMDKDYLKILNSITEKDIQKFAKNLLKQGNRIEVCMTSTPTK